MESWHRHDIEVDPASIIIAWDNTGFDALVSSDFWSVGWWEQCGAVMCSLWRSSPLSGRCLFDPLSAGYLSPIVLHVTWSRLLPACSRPPTCLSSVHRRPHRVQLLIPRRRGMPAADRGSVEVSPAAGTAFLLPKFSHSTAQVHCWRTVRGWWSGLQQWSVSLPLYQQAVFGFH